MVTSVSSHQKSTKPFPNLEKNIPRNLEHVAGKALLANIAWKDGT